MVEEKKKDTIFVSYIKELIFKKNKNFFMIVVGSTGSGKSYSALKLAELLDPTFTIDRCCFKAIDFMRKVKELQNQAEEQKKAIKGKVILWDEMGVEHNAREFMTTSNRAINFFFQTSRYLNLIVIMTVPYLSFIDSASRKLCHCIAETQGINQREKQSTLKIKFLQVAPLTSKEYPKYLRYKQNNKSYVLKKIGVGIPNKDLLELYEKKKRAYGSWLYEDTINKLEKAEEKNKRQKVERFHPGSMQEDIWVLATTTKWKTYTELGEKLSKKRGKEVDLGQLSNNIKSMRKNGYNIADFKQI